MCWSKSISRSMVIIQRSGAITWLAYECLSRFLLAIVHFSADPFKLPLVNRFLCGLDHETHTPIGRLPCTASSAQSDVCIEHTEPICAICRIFERLARGCSEVSDSIAFPLIKNHHRFNCSRSSCHNSSMRLNKDQHIRRFATFFHFRPW